MSKRILGLFGGSFDPPHKGHEQLLQWAQALLPELWVVPVGLPVHKRLSARVSAMQRLQWMQRLCQPWPHVQVHDWEVQRQQQTATIQSLRQLHQRCDDLFPLCLMGEDSWQSMASWQGYPEHQSLCSVMVFPRQHYAPMDLEGWRSCSYEQWQAEPQHGWVMRADCLLPDVSASDVRAGQAAFAASVPECIRDEVIRFYGDSCE